MKKITLLVFAQVFLLLADAQSYWQQQVDYKIDVALNDKQHDLKGFLTLEYTNNSPDKLDYIWFHLWPNAYKNENTAFAKQVKGDKDGDKRLKAIKDNGFIDSLAFRAAGQKLKTEAHPEYIDVIKVLLAQPLESGKKITITTPFYTKMATYNSRSGHDGQSYMVCQWYPKPAVYDRKGWHPIPYLDQGEFYSEFGNFTVNITTPSNYILGASGTLQNEAERTQYKTIGKANVAAKSKTNKIAYKPSGVNKTLTYKAENVHDFAWFANKDFVIRYDTLQMASGKTVDVFTYHHPDGNKNWVNSTEYVKDGTRSYSSYIGEYVYPVVQAVEGPKNDMSGGMEYPMITLITSPTADEKYLDAVITHEVGHNWFYGMLASNERQHAWLDEGINTYYQFRYEAEKWRANSIFGNDIPIELTQKPLNEFQAAVYGVMANAIPMEGAIETPAADFKNKEEYGIVTYIKTAIWMYALEQEFGKEKLDKAVQAYFNQWKFKHPYPEDFRAVFEKELGRDLTAYFDLLNKKGAL
ncbi:MAG: M1 family metallopeptidase [Gloeobacteraceae cyanobacterium ES-bin-316]|nr:M1 family metallopeptidase [Ferruginibacter sp.]